MVKIVEGSPLGMTPDRKATYANQKQQPSLERFINPSKELTKIEFSEESHTMMLGEQYNPEIVFSPKDVGYIDLDWVTNNPAILKLSGESIWAVGTGNAIVTATTKDNVLSASMLIHVAVHNVDTSQAPPDVTGSMKEDNSNITEDYEPISEDLIYLMINGKNILSKETLINKIWGYDSDAGDNNVEAYISFLRKKLTALKSRVSIAVVRKVGYHLDEA